MKPFFKNHWYSILVFLILFIAAFFRFYHFPYRCGLAYDQARDTLISREALRQKKIALVGPFTSAASVVYGPQWFWILSLFTVLKSDFLFLPWLILGVLYVMIVFFMIKVGEMVGDRKLGLLAGLITAFSPMQIWQSLNLTTPNFVAFMSVLAMVAMLEYLKTKNSLFAFLLGTILAVAVNIHLQAIGLLFLIPVTAFFGWKHKFRAVFLFLLGFLLQFIPLVIFELKTGFYNFQGLVSYLAYGQYQLEGPTPWSVYLFSFWPKLWVKISGGNEWLAYFQIAGTIFLLGWRVLKKKLPKAVLALGVSFLLIFISLRFYRGAKFESYYAFIHSFVLFFSAWFIWRIYHWRRGIAFLFLLPLLVGSLQLNLDYYRVEKNSYSLLKSWREALISQFPGQKFAVYDYKFLSQDKTASLSLVLDADGLIDDEGVKIGVSRHPESISKKTFYDQGYSLTDITAIKKEGDDWVFLNPSEIWKATEEWYYYK